LAHQKNGTQGTAYGTNNRRTTLWGETEPWSNVCSTRTTAWHANAESLTTIGIEHNARDPGDATLSGIQYWKSAELVVWLGRQMAIPMDRWYILGHSEIDPGTSHSRCPQRALDWDTYMLAIAEVQAAAEGRPPLQPMRLWTADD
jgi:N-acetyl-anhydromuramyl-L-alanine amidase AmpD